MMLKAMIKTIAIISSIVGIMSFTGCSMNTNLVKQEDITVERVNSSSVNITRAYLQATDTTWILKGKLTRRLSNSHLIPGHLHIELVGPDGAVFKEADIAYKRKRAKSRFAEFYLPIPVELTEISRVRVIHHDALSHKRDSVKSPWRDVKKY